MRTYSSNYSDLQNCKMTFSFILDQLLFHLSFSLESRDMNMIKIMDIMTTSLNRLVSSRNSPISISPECLILKEYFPLMN